MKLYINTLLLCMTPAVSVTVDLEARDLSRNLEMAMPSKASEGRMRLSKADEFGRMSMPEPIAKSQKAGKVGGLEQEIKGGGAIEESPISAKANKAGKVVLNVDELSLPDAKTTKVKKIFEGKAKTSKHVRRFLETNEFGLRALEDFSLSVSYGDLSSFSFNNFVGKSEKGAESEEAEETEETLEGDDEISPTAKSNKSSKVGKGAETDDEPGSKSNKKEGKGSSKSAKSLEKEARAVPDSSDSADSESTELKYSTSLETTGTSVSSSMTADSSGSSMSFGLVASVVVSMSLMAVAIAEIY